jgi:hypothetical protein
MQVMSTKSREVIWGGKIIGAKVRAEGARKRAAEATREADRAEAEAWSIRMEGYGGPASRPRRSGNACTADTAGLKLNATTVRPARASHLMRSGVRAIRPIWKLATALKCRSCKEGRYAPPVHMIKLTQEREIRPYVWVHLDEDR